MKFSIRDLMWLTAVVALMLAWWADHRRWLPHNLTQREVERLERDNNIRERYLHEIDEQLVEHGLRLEESFYGKRPGWPKMGHMEVVPLDKVELERGDNLLNPLAPAPKK